MTILPSIFACISAAKDIILALSGVATATIAYVGLSRWRSELRGRADFDAARATAKAAYKLRDVLQGARSPFMSSAEFPEGYENNFTSPTPAERAKALAHAYQNRWAPVWEAIQELNALALEAEILWGADARAPIDALRGCALELRIAMQERIEDTARGSIAEQANPRRDEDTSARLWTGFPRDPNRLDEKIDKAIKDLDQLLRPHLARAKS